MDQGISVQYAYVPSVGWVPDQREGGNIAEKFEEDHKNSESNPRVLEALVVDHRVVGVLRHEEEEG